MIPSSLHIRPRSHAAALIGLATLLSWALWLWLGRDALRWLVRDAFLGRDPAGNRLLLLLVAALLAPRLLPHLRRLPDGVARLLLGAAPQAAPLSLLCAAALGQILLLRSLPIHILSAALLLLGAYALLGLSLRPADFRAGLPSLLLVVAVLPFGALADSYVGTSVRVATAQSVHDLLGALHVASLPTQTILVLDNGVADIEAACSGLRSLWVGLLGYLGLLWLSRRGLDGRAVLGGAAVAGLLLLSNLLRVTALVLAALVLHAPTLAEGLHAPLSLLGLLLALVVGALILRQAPAADPRAGSAPLSASPAPPASSSPLPPASPAPPWFAPVLALSLLALLPLVPAPAALTASAVWLPPLPAGISGTPLPLDEAESHLFTHHGARAAKWRVRAPGDGSQPALAGSLLVVAAAGPTGFRAHHPPELCLSGAGFQIDAVLPLSLSPGVELRELRLHDRRGARTAVYWFQSESSTTADLLQRMYRALSGGERRWLLVSLVLDQPVYRADPGLRRLLQTLHGAFAQGLRRGADTSSSDLAAAVAGPAHTGALR